jgi:hypothetical protein
MRVRGADNMNPIKYSAFFDDKQGMTLTSSDEQQIDYVNRQFEHIKKKQDLLHIPSDNIDYYIVMDKVRVYAIEKLKLEEVKTDAVQEPEPTDIPK